MKNKQLSVIRCYYAAKPPPCVRHKQNGLRINQKKKKALIIITALTLIILETIVIKK